MSFRRRDPEPAESTVGSEFSEGIDRYRADEESSIGGARASSSFSAASTRIIQNTLNNTMSPGGVASPTGASRNSIAASRLLRSRKTRGKPTLPTVPTVDDEPSVRSESPSSESEQESRSAPKRRSRSRQSRSRRSQRRAEGGGTTAPMAAAATSPEASATTRRTLRDRVSQRKRVAGGAAAKIMLQSLKEEEEARKREEEARKREHAERRRRESLERRRKKSVERRRKESVERKRKDSVERRRKESVERKRKESVERKRDGERKRELVERKREAERTRDPAQRIKKSIERKREPVRRRREPLQREGSSTSFFAVDDKYSLSFDDDDDDDYDDDGASVTSEQLHEERVKARHEFILGPNKNSRYRPGDSDGEKSEMTAEDYERKEEKEVSSDASVPSILNRSEVFHDNAAAAVIALLTPRHGRGSDGTSSVLSGGTSIADELGFHLASGKDGIMVTTEKTTGKAFQYPRAEKDASTVLSGMSNVVDAGHEPLPKSPTTPVITTSVVKQLDDMKSSMVDPTKTLADLLHKIVTPPDPSTMDRGFMVRRKNACGALKILTMNSTNRRTMCWTVGVLPALTSVLQDTGDEGLDSVFPDIHTRREYRDARTRSVASLLNLSTLKENRIPMFHCPGLMQSIVGVMNDDKSESRQGCCAILAYLAKTPENRLLLIHVPGLIDAICAVLRPSQTTDGQTIKNDGVQGAMGRNDSSMTDTSAERLTLDSEIPYSNRRGSRADDDSDMTPQMTTSPTNPGGRDTGLYDRDRNQFLHGARQNVFALLLSVVKEKDNTYSLVRHQTLVATLVAISRLQDSPSHVHCVKILAHMTRHRHNSKHIVFQTQIVVPAMVLATTSNSEQSRMYACYALQNLSQDRSCRQEVASTKGLVMALCHRARQSNNKEEKLASISALKNLTDDPANLIPMTNTPECFATLMQIAHGHDDQVTERMQYLACDALATLSHWLRRIASSGQKVDGKPARLDDPASMFVPSLKVVSWNQWA